MIDRNRAAAVWNVRRVAERGLAARPDGQKPGRLVTLESQRGIGTAPAGAADVMPPVQGLGILRTPGFLVLYLNTTFVNLAALGQHIGRAWLAFQLTGSNAALGGTLLAFGVATLVTTPWAGVAADRLSKRLVIQAGVALFVTSSTWIGLAVAFGVVEYWMLIATGVLQGVGFSLFNPARMAFVGEIMPPESVSRAVSLMLVNSELTRVVGPAVAGLVIGTLTHGTEAVFLVSAVLLTIGALLTGALPHGRRSSDPPDRSPLAELIDGVRYVRGQPLLGALLWCGFGVTVAGLPYMAFLPAVAGDLFDFGSTGYGVLSATSAAGAVVVGTVLARRWVRARETSVLIAGGGMVGVGLLGLALAPTFPLAVTALFTIGGAMLAFQTANQTLLITLSALEYRGRVQGLLHLSLGGFGIVALPLGVLADTVGLRWTLGGMGSACVVIVLGFALRQRARVVRASRLRHLG